MRNNRISKIIKHDLTIGMKQNTPKYILIAFFISLFCMMFFNGVTTFQLTEQIVSKGSMMDCTIYIFKGMNVYIPSVESPFQIPIIWLLIQVMIAFFIVNYPTQDLHSYGLQILARTKNRFLWWSSKCIWNIFTVVSIYLTCFTCILLLTLFFGKLSLTPNAEISLLINEFELYNLKLSQLFVAVFVLPILTSIAISLLQMTISFILTPVYSYMIIVCIMVASAYFCSPIFIGNFSMILRNQLIYSEGSNNLTAIVMNIVVIIISITVGHLYFSRYDILKMS